MLLMHALLNRIDADIKYLWKISIWHFLLVPGLELSSIMLLMHLLLKSADADIKSDIDSRVELLPGFKFTGKMVKKNKFTGKIGKKR